MINRKETPPYVSPYSNQDATVDTSALQQFLTIRVAIIEETEYALHRIDLYAARNLKRSEERRAYLLKAKDITDPNQRIDVAALAIIASIIREKNRYATPPPPNNEAVESRTRIEGTIALQRPTFKEEEKPQSKTIAALKQNNPLLRKKTPLHPPIEFMRPEKDLDSGRYSIIDRSKKDGK